MTKTRGPETVAYDGGQLFRVTHVEQPNRPGGKPYEFVHRIGAVHVLPVTSIEGQPHVLAIKNTRAHYGTSFGLPGGHRDGGFDTPEPVIDAGLRELTEETGYGYSGGSPVNVDAFDLRRISATIRYPRSFMVARNVIEIGGAHNNPREQVVPELVPLDEYASPLFDGDRTELHPEINVSFMRAGLLLGREAVLNWLQHGQESAYASDVIQSFSPWLCPTE